jgi:hypothetical protein
MLMVMVGKGDRILDVFLYVGGEVLEASQVKRDHMTSKDRKGQVGSATRLLIFLLYQPLPSTYWSN